MSDDSMRAKARATFGKEFMNILKPQAPAKNGAVALQKRANARPIPTYKDGGKVEDARVAARMAAGNYKKGGKLTKKADGGVMDQYSGMPAPLRQPVAAADAYDGSSYGAGPKPMQQMVANPNMPAPAYKKGGKAKKDGLAVMIAIGKPIKEKATGERYPSKKAMAKHEAAESAGMERMERMKPMKKAVGGSVQGMTPQMPVVKSGAGKVMGAAEIAAERRKQAGGGERLSPDEVQRRAKAAATSAQATATLQKLKDAQATRAAIQQKNNGLMAANRQQAEKNAAAKAALAPKMAENKRMQEANAASMAKLNQMRAANATTSAANLQKMAEVNQRQTALGQPTPMPIDRRYNPADPREIIVTATKPTPPPPPPPPPLPMPVQYRKGGSAMKPVKRAVGGAGKTRKGMC
jgi:hypothetical protein